MGRYGAGLGASGSKAGLDNEPDPDLWPEGSRRIEPLRFRRAPLLFAAVCFGLGELLARAWQPAIVLLLAISLLLGLTLFALWRSLRISIVPLAALWMAVGMWCAEIRPAPQPQSAFLSYADGLSRTVRGRVVRVRELPAHAPIHDQDREIAGWGEREEEPGGGGDRAISVDLRVEGIEEVTPDISRMIPVSGGVRATLIYKEGEPVPELGCGDLVEAPMRLKVPERYRDPGAWQYADYLLEQGLGATASVPGGKLRAAGRGAGTLQCRIFAAQSWASGRMNGYVRSTANRHLPSLLRLNADDAGMLNAMLFGERSGLNHALRLGFERTGSFHLFVVSGMHVALVAGGVFWLVRRLRLREWIATLATLAVTAGYAVLTGFGAPVQRALWMTVIFLAARLLSRDRSVLNALGAATLGILAWSPGALFEASFQMTSLAIVAIGGIAVPLGDWSFLPYARAARNVDDVWMDPVLRPPVAQFRVMLRLWGDAAADLLGVWARRLPATFCRWCLWAGELALIGTVAEMVMVLPMAVYFHRATVFALPANMVSVPVVALLVPIAVLTFCLALLNSWAALLPGAMTALLLHGITRAIGLVSTGKWTHGPNLADLRVPGPAWWVAMLAVAGFAFCCWASRRSARWAIAAAVVLPLVAVVVLWPERPEIFRDAMEVTAIDVGQGDSMLVVAPGGGTMLVDAGGPVGGLTEAEAATSRFDVGEEVVSTYLWSRRLRRLDVLALTHAHSDHMGGMPAVLRNLRPRELWVGIDANSDAYRSLISEARDLGVGVRHLRAGDTERLGTAEVDILAPAAEYSNPGDPKNDDSLVMRVRFGEASVLLEGDAEAPSEHAMLASGRLGPVTLLKVGHHGSRTSTTPEFFAAVKPADAVVSVGKGNTFGHPRQEVIERIAEGHTRLYRTDEFGLSTFLLRRDGGIREVEPTSN